MQHHMMLAPNMTAVWGEQIWIRTVRLLVELFDLKFGRDEHRFMK